MSTKRVHNFNAGPSILPLEVIEEIRDNFVEFKGMSVLEISHRSKEFEAIMDEVKNLVAELMGVPKNYHILFLQGGASLQFAMIPMNFMDGVADYSLTGYWAKKSFAEAKLFGTPHVAFSSEGTNFNRTPKASEINLADKTSYLHITTNNTIYGTEYYEFPNTGNVPLIADMSSDIMSQKIDVEKFSLIYAGAQKNLGPAGVTLVVIRDDLTIKNIRPVSTMLRYSTHIENNSLYNTPPVFAVYATMLTLRWLKKNGGVSAIEKLNREKAALIYNVIDHSSFYKSPVEKDSRSIMNITFTLPSEELTSDFLKKVAENNMVGLKGHRAIGGIRASIYNAMPKSSVEALTEFMKNFERSR